MQSSKSLKCIAVVCQNIFHPCAQTQQFLCVWIQFTLDILFDHTAQRKCPWTKFRFNATNILQLVHSIETLFPIKGCGFDESRPLNQKWTYWMCSSSKP